MTWTYPVSRLEFDNATIVLMESTTLRNGGRAGGYPVRSETLHHGAKSTVNLPPIPRNKAVPSGFTTCSHHWGNPIRPAIKALFPEGWYTFWVGAPGWRAINMEGVEDAHNVWSISGQFFWERPTNAWSTQLAVKQLGNCSPTKISTQKASDTTTLLS